MLIEGGYKDIARAHLQKDIHIRNIGDFRPIAFSHNFGLITRYGLKIIGIDTKPPTNTVSLISHFETVIKALNNDLADMQQAFDGINLFLAPFVSNLPRLEIKHVIERIIYSIDQLYLVSGIKSMRVVLNLPTSIPSYLKKCPAYVGGKMAGNLGDYESEVETLLELFMEVLKEKGTTTAPKIIFKIGKKVPEKIATVLDQVYIANLNPSWQAQSTNYMFDWCRLDSRWKGHKKAIGVPAMQMISINLPRLGYLTKDEDKIYELIRERLRLIKKCFLLSMERIISEIYRKPSFISKRVGTDKYCHFDDGIFLIGIVGLANLIQNLTGDYVGNKDLALKILKFISKESKIENIRTGLIEVDFSPYSTAFTRADRYRFGVKEKKYYGGVDTKLEDCEKIKFMGHFHKILSGGHMCQLSKLDMELVQKILKSNVGLAAGKGLNKL
jgi:ribonucleoside-triphosphate reductase